MFETGVDFWAKKVFETIDARIVWYVDGISLGGIIGETGVLQHSAVENEFQHERVSPEPTVGLIMRLVAETMVGKVRTEIVKERILGAIG